MQDRPTATELLAAARAFLHGELAPALADHRLRFRTLIAANILAIIERELTGEQERLAAMWRRLTTLLAPGEAAEPPARLNDLKRDIAARRAELCRRIRAGEADVGPWRAAALAYARWEVEEKLRVSNPSYLARFEGASNEGAGGPAGG
jgi:hypothetical protein